MKKLVFLLLKQLLALHWFSLLSFPPEDESFHFFRNLKSSLSGSLSQSSATDTPLLLPPELLSAPMVFVRTPPAHPPPKPLPIPAHSRSFAAHHSPFSSRSATELTLSLSTASSRPTCHLMPLQLNRRSGAGLLLTRPAHPYSRSLPAPPPPYPSLPPMSSFPCLRQPVLAAPTDSLLIYQISYLHEILGGRM
jgi:hypothetical protein